MSAPVSPPNDILLDQDDWISWLQHDGDVWDSNVDLAGANVGNAGDTTNANDSAVKDLSLIGPQHLSTEALDSINCIASENLPSNDPPSEDTSWLSSSGYHGVPSDSSVGSVDSFASASRLRRRRRQTRQQMNKTQGRDTARRRYQCTFCTDAFKTKHDWQRHETTMHLSLEQWKCSRYGPTVHKPHGEICCVFCDCPNPSIDHAELHNYSACAAQPDEARLFRRKDHLRQHLRLFHQGCNFNESMKSWLTSIDDRQKHLAVHFRAGTDMTEWKGGRGFDQKIEELVENDMPAFLIGDQRRTMEPFSASRADHRIDTRVLSPLSTNEASPGHEVAHSSHSHQEVQRLLLRYVSDEISQGHVPSDRQIQRKMSEIIYGPDNAWDSTWADNPQWLDMFRKKAGLISLPLSGGKNAFIGF
ncbi:homeobox and c2h2 transcription factor [Fusarium beomiforme]|uniref:Homeobox and c2h2 transcription factor n=1 Tax=Fusarium beomiforme TaxID=44412 RepID=A0A9P5DST3_9HYPO|nr:homeobox and c2h2 transcription factor [Fusarium beomiforme]